MLSLPHSYQAEFVFALIGAVVVLMASNRVRYDLIALLVVLALMLSQVLSVSEALAGFSNSTVVLIAALLVVGSMLERTGVARLVGDWILRHGGQQETRLLMMIMVSSALLSAVMSSTAVVAIFIPIMLRIAKTTSISASRLLLPMSYAALVSGMLTLIATPPNLVISSELQNSGFAPLGFFSFSPLGLLVLFITIAYMLLVGRHWLPAPPAIPLSAGYGRPLQAMWQDYQVEQTITSLKILPGSPLDDVTLAESRLHSDDRLRVLAIMRTQRRSIEYHSGPDADFRLRTGDVMMVAAPPKGLEQISANRGLEHYPLSAKEEQHIRWELGAISVLIHPNSQLTGKSIRESAFRTRYGLEVFGLRRSQNAIEAFEDIKLEPSDSLLVSGPWHRIRNLQLQNHDFVVLESPEEASEPSPAYRKIPVALAITAAMILFSLFNWIPLVAVVLLAAVAGVVTRCLSAQEAYGAIHWQSLVLLAGMLPLADALQKTGALEEIVSALMGLVGDAGPGAMLAILFFATMLLTNILSNTASAVLMAPVAIGAAEALGVSPYPLAIGILMAASSAFLTPVASPIITLVVEPGRYQFSDFLKSGSILVLIVFAVTWICVPLLFPW